MHIALTVGQSWCVGTRVKMTRSVLLCSRILHVNKVVIACKTTVKRAVFTKIVSEVYTVYVGWRTESPSYYVSNINGVNTQRACWVSWLTIRSDVWAAHVETLSYCVALQNVQRQRLTITKSPCLPPALRTVAPPPKRYRKPASRWDIQACTDTKPCQLYNASSDALSIGIKVSKIILPHPSQIWTSRPLFTMQATKPLNYILLNKSEFVANLAVQS
jgi:hypothetical protein